LSVGEIGFVTVAARCSATANSNWWQLLHFKNKMPSDQSNASQNPELISCRVANRRWALLSDTLRGVAGMSLGREVAVTPLSGSLP